MSKGTGFFMNFDKFGKSFKHIAEDVIPDKAGEASFKVGSMIIHDAIYIEPFAPFDEGSLRSSERVEPIPDKLGVIVGFDIEYAAKWHELPKSESNKIAWTTPGSGSKYILVKLVMFKDKYIAFLASLIHA